jgi:DNA-binding CsgD family transcriptional regulator/nitrite reductase/ring-hydroxylating ferredoxin subunit
MGRMGRPRHPDLLTPREWEVLALLRERLTNEEIAQSLGISLDGAKYHVSQILSKLGVATREEAAAIALSERRRWWAAWPLAAKIAGAATVVAAGAGLALLTWGVIRTSGDENIVAGPMDVGATDEFQLGEPTRFEDSEGQGFWVVRLDDEFVALSETDTHRRFSTDECRIAWRTDVLFLGREGWLRGTCSGSNFDLEGRLLSGPSPASMYRFPLQITDGRVIVDTSTPTCSPLDASTEFCDLPQPSP